MQPSVFTRLLNSLRAANEWYLRTPERSLDEAYQAVQNIKALENAHFNGNKIAPNSTYSRSAYALIESELKGYLKTARMRLTEFRYSRSMLRLSNQRITEVQIEEASSDNPTISVIDQPALVLKKLKVIDEVLARYGNTPDALGRPAAIVSYSDQPALSVAPPVRARPAVAYRDPMRRPDPAEPADEKKLIADKTGVLPRSILNTVDRIKRDLDPESEVEMVENFRNTKARTMISIRFILLLLVIPLLTQQITKYFVVGPIVDHLRSGEQVEVFLNPEMEEEAFGQLRSYEEHLRFQGLVGKEVLTSEQIEARLAEKAEEIQAEYREESSGAIKNVFSDIFAVCAFVLILTNSKREIATLKTFVDETVYGLSDSAKAFIIILLTDTFVGFHSPHGWEVLLEGASRHFGLPSNRDFIFLFIATFPVLLDTIFKYWIFRYLNRISPSAVATYRNMNE
ncbi:proton extrusion protein PcxA [Microcoleus sp. FACHB-1515]|uniref:proton extrusion protein PcxA n=1 Tax=Cyanophyceae TaxID=3028117 RepID=UPI001683E0D6|nr:proton extrusion protein PcxA [Microcoleus sp. FACHB-1515]MBD2090407.1 proton extrusion protein PcxA [Microcoleus sp. FACHB-1515]